MKIKKRILTFICVTTLMASALSGCIGRASVNVSGYKTSADKLSFTKYSSEAVVTVEPSADQTILLDDYQKKCENKFLSLYFNDKNAAVAVFDRRSGKIWFSNNPAFSDDDTIDSSSLNMYMSQLYISYIDGQNSKQVDSFTLSVEEGNFEYENKDRQLSVTYHFINNTKTEDKKRTKELFTVKLLYELQEESLIVTVPVEDISYDKMTPPLQITVLPHFGAASNSENGYVFVPDGSGALLNFDKDKFSSSSYYGSVYGNDESLDISSEPLKTQVVTLPVFGMKSDNNAFIAIIEDAAAIAAINATRAGAYSSYNEVFASFTTFSSQIISIGNMDNSSKTYGTQKTPYKGTLRIRYAFLDTNESDYSGMANYYRSYLKLTEHLEKEKKSNDGIAFNLELVASADKLVSTLGIRHNSMVSLTSTKEAQIILEEFMAENIKNINLQYTGWMNGGISQEFADKVSPVGKIGGKSGIKKLNGFTTENGINFYPSASLLTSLDGSSGFSKFSMASRQIDQKDAKSYTYDYVTKEEKSFSYVISPLAFSNIFDSFIKSYSKLGVSNVAISDIASKVNADYTSSQIIDRETSVNIVKEQLEKLNSKFDSLMISTGNAYAVPYADVAVMVPFESSGYSIFDCNIPFYQMVYHGLIKYSGSPINLSYQYDTDVLKCIEYGGSPFFQMMYADGSILKNTKYDYLCSSNFAIWKDDAVKTYKKVNSALNDVQDSFLVSHKKIADGVFSAKYENGITIYVNYNDKDYSDGSLTVKSGDFTVQKGDSK